MIRLLMAGLLLVSFTAVADTKVTHTFEDGGVIKAEEFNENFDDLEAAIDNISAGPPGPQGATGPTGPTGPAGPVGADGAAGVAAGLNCSIDEIIKYDGNGWVCSSRTLVNSGGSIASCPAGSQVTGGGCVFEAVIDQNPPNYVSSQSSRPSDDLTAWECSCTSQTSCNVFESFAICQ